MGTLSVHTFFFMTGLLVCYLLLRELDRNKGRFNVLMFYIHRYLRYLGKHFLQSIPFISLKFVEVRLTPVYAIIVGFMATLVVYIGSGPYWPVVEFNSQSCRWNWWINLLYINNYITTGVFPGVMQLIF